MMIRHVALVLLSLLVVGQAARAEVFSLDFMLLPTTPAVNTLDLEVSALIASDSDDVELSGNLLADIDFSFDAAGIATAETIDLTGGTIAISDTSLSLRVLFDSIDVDTSGITATFDTPNPPGPVSGGQFDTIDHQLILNSGIVVADGNVLGTPVDVAVDFSTEPLATTTSAIATLSFDPPQRVGNTDVYDARLTLPVDFDEVVTDTPVEVRVRADGTIEAVAQFSRTVTALSDLTLDGAVDFDDMTLLLSSWDLTATAAQGNIVQTETTPVDFDDLTFLLSEWTGTLEAPSASGVSAVPEPSTLALATLAALALMAGRFRISSRVRR